MKREMLLFMWAMITLAALFGVVLGLLADDPIMVQYAAEFWVGGFVAALLLAHLWGEP